MLNCSGSTDSPAGFNTGLHTLQSINPKLLEQVFIKNYMHYTVQYCSSV